MSPAPSGEIAQAVLAKHTDRAINIAQEDGCIRLANFMPSLKNGRIIRKLDL